MQSAENMIYLASKSPRRRELLRQIGVEFELLQLRSDGRRGMDVTEEVLRGETPEVYVARVAHEKAHFALRMVRLRNMPPRLVLSADTTVTIDGRILGKPGSVTEARGMLELLSGRTHQVLTSVAVCSETFQAQITQTSEVRFGVLTPEAIAAYCASKEPFDKAGGYGIQGMAGQFIEHISGSHSGIMGLPLYDTAQLLKQAGLPLL